MGGAVFSYKFKPGWITNPLLRYRNIQCPCKSLKKAKHCCGKMHAVPEKVASNLKKYLAVYHPKGE